jgi:hypothetical protein
MHIVNLLLVAPTLAVLAIVTPAQDVERPTRAPAATPTKKPASGESSTAQDAEEAKALMREMEVTIEQVAQAKSQATSVRMIVDKLDEGAVKATDEQLVKTNQYVRQQLAKDYRELRARSRAVVTQVNTVLLPRQRGVATKLKTRWELEPDAAVKSKIAKLVADHEQQMTETTVQMTILERNIGNLTTALQVLENQLSYLDLVEESLGLSKQINSQLKELNQEIDKVVAAFMEKEAKS